MNNIKKKWAILIPRFLPEKIGGNFTYVDWFAQNLAVQGHTVYVFTTTLDADLAKREERKGFIINRILVKKGNAGSLRFSSTRALTELFLETDKEMHFDILNPHAPFQINYSKLRKSIRVVHTLHAVVTYEYLFTLKKIFAQGRASKLFLKELFILPLKLPVCFFREMNALKKAQHIIVMSNYVKQTIKWFFPNITGKKIFVSRIGIDAEKFTPSDEKTNNREALGLPSDGTVFFTVRRLSSRMGLENLIKACFICSEIAPDKKFYLYIAGKGDLHELLSNLISKYQLLNNVFLLGFIDDDALLSYYQASDVFVLPTEALEGFGIVTIEALACNLPVIATPAGANREVAGLFCPELITQNVTAEAIAEKMLMFINQKNEYSSKQYGLDVKRKFNWKEIIAELEEEVVPSES